MKEAAFQALTVETLGARLGGLDAVAGKIGGPPKSWKVREVGDGNLNLVFIVDGADAAVVVKQALPYVRLVGESWPLPLKRSFFEHHALTRQRDRAPGSVPEVFHFDEAQALIVMEYLTPHVILRRALIDGQKLPRIASDIGLFMARTLFRGSDLHMKAADRKADLALFAGNAELCDITENLVFSDPYFEAPMNRHTAPLDALVAELRADRDLKVEAQQLKHLFAANAETMVHGDLHTGSIMVTASDTRVIDPEFAFYGPMAFDVGMLMANFWMACLSQRGHEKNAGERDTMRQYLLGVVVECWSVFRQEFARLWRTERTGMLYSATVFEQRADPLGAEQALNRIVHGIWTDMLGFAGVEMHRRILGLAHNADFEEIADADLRAACEARALKLGRHLAVNRRRIQSIGEINALAEMLDRGEVS